MPTRSDTDNSPYEEMFPVTLTEYQGMVASRDAFRDEVTALKLQVRELQGEKDRREATEKALDIANAEHLACEKQLKEDRSRLERLNDERLKAIEAFKCSAKAEECTARHFGYNLAIDDVLEILREPLKRFGEAALQRGGPTDPDANHVNESIGYVALKRSDGSPKCLECGKEAVEVWQGICWNCRTSR